MSVQFVESFSYLLRKILCQFLCHDRNSSCWMLAVCCNFGYFGCTLTGNKNISDCSLRKKMTNDVSIEFTFWQNKNKIAQIVLKNWNEFYVNKLVFRIRSKNDKMMKLKTMSEKNVVVFRVCQFSVIEFLLFPFFC